MRKFAAAVVALIACAVAPVAGAQTTITLVDQRFVCTSPLSSLGELPIVLEQTLMNTSAAANHIRGAIALDSGCAGDGNPETTDLVIHQYGDGRSLGPAFDALVMRPGAHDLNVEGFLNCGFLGQDAHQDGLDIRGGEDVTFSVEIGDWDTLFPTCHGAGGLFYPSGFWNGGPLGNRASEYVQRVLCVECKMVGSKGFYDSRAGSFGTAVGIYESVDSGAIDSCFAANRPWIVRLDNPSEPGAIRPVDVNNVKLDLDDNVPDDPSACPLGDDPPPPPPPPAQCADGVDNDGDAAVDMADAGCSSSEDNDESDDPPPPPPPPTCDQACVDAYEALILTLTSERDEARADVARLESIIDRAAAVLAEE